jgi:hypothetical protein
LENKPLQYLVLSEPLPTGIYLIEPKSIGDSAFLETGRHSLPKLNGRNILVVEKDKLGFESLKDILVQIVIAGASRKEELWVRLANIDYSQIKRDFDINCIRLLASLICHYEQNASGHWEKLLEQINLHFLNSAVRASLLCGLLELSLPDEQFKICYQALCLNLAYFEQGTQLPVMSQVHDYYREDELLFQLQAQPDKLDEFRAESRLGESAFDSDIDWKRMFGNSEDLQGKCDLQGRPIKNEEGLFDWEGKYITFHPARQPKDGVFFAGATYVDLLARWMKPEQNPKKRDEYHISEIRLGELDKYRKSVIYLDDKMKLLKKQLKNEYPFLHEQIEERNLPNAFYPLFYYNAVAAMMLTHGIDNQGIAEQYLVHMTRIFPELVRRDMLLCRWMIYKEERDTNAIAPTGHNESNSSRL